MSKQDHHHTGAHSQLQQGVTHDLTVKNEMRDLIDAISGRLRDEGQRHSDLLAQMNDRLRALGAEAEIARIKVPNSFQPAIQNIKDGLDLLSQKVSESGAGAPVASPLFDETASFGNSGLKNETGPTSGSDEASEPGVPPVALMSAAPATPTGTQKNNFSNKASGGRVDPFDVVGGGDVDDDPDNPWDKTSAEALARVYENQDDVYSASTDDAYEIMQSASQHGGDKTDSLVGGVAAQAPFVLTPQSIVDASPASSVEASANKDWLEERFAEIAAKLEVVHTRNPIDDALVSLNSRLDTLEEKFTSAIDDVSARSDAGGLRIVESHINEIGVQLQQAHEKFERLDAIEVQLGSVVKQLNEVPEPGVGQIEPAIIEDVATAAALKATEQLSQTGAIGGDNNDSELRIGELQNALNSFMDEQRQGGLEAQTMLETLQQAMIRVLDRVDAIEDGVKHQDVSQVQPSMPLSDAYINQGSSTFDGFHETFENEIPTSLGDGAEADVDHSVNFASPLSGQSDSSFMEQSPQSHSSTENTNLTSELVGHEAGLEKPPLVPEASGVQFGDDGELQSPFDLVPGTEPATGDVAQAAPELKVGQAQPHEQVETDEVMIEGAPNAPLVTNNDLQKPDNTIATDEIKAVRKDDSINKMRQDLIATAQKAKLQAAADAAKSLQDGQKKKGLGLKLRKNKADEEKTPNDTGDQKAGGLFGLGKRKSIVNSLVLLCAVPAFGLVWFFGDVENHLFKGDVTLTGSNFGASSNGDILSNPMAADKQAIEGNVIAPEDIRPGGAIPKKASPDGQQRRMTDASGANAAPVIRGSADTNSTVAAVISNTPAGMTIYDPGRKLTAQQAARVDERVSMAERSVKLGHSSVPSMPAAFGSYDATPGQLGAGPAKPVVQSGAHLALSMPPATVGPTSLRLAAAKGHPSAQFQVATRLSEAKGNRQNFAEAAKWFKRSASQGFAQSQYRLGTLYERGLGVGKDISRAKIWYRRAAEQGNVKSMHNLAVFSANPQNRSPDYTTAAHWFGEAAERGLADSQFNLAVLYENGLGVPKDLKQAYKYFALASQGGDADAARRRDGVILRLETEELAEAEALVKSFRKKRTDRLVNDANAAAQAWKSSSLQNHRRYR